MNNLRTTLRFASKNEFKDEEMKRILGDRFNLIGIRTPLVELQTENQTLLIEDKVLKAFQEIGQPVFVEHTGLYFDCLNTLPGGLTSIFWDRLKADGMINFYNKLGGGKVIAKTIIGYIDGKQIHVFDGELNGSLASSPRGSDEFAWDCIFIPEGKNQTFAEMGIDKDELSMRRKALDKLVEFLLPKPKVKVLT